MSDRKTRRELTQRLDDPDPEVRVTAALRLVELGEDRAVPVLQSLLKDPSADRTLRSTTRWTLNHIAEKAPGETYASRPLKAGAQEVARTVLRRALELPGERAANSEHRALERRKALKLFLASSDISPDEAAELLAFFYDDSSGGEGFVKGDPEGEPVRELGRRLNALGGFTLMRQAHALFSDLRPAAARNLEMVWDGIGTWSG